MYRTLEQWIEAYRNKGALWIHNGKKQAHALLRSGLHSSGFFNSRLVIADEEMLQEAASDLVEKYIGTGRSIFDVQVVVGPKTGATKLAELIAKEISEITGVTCCWASPEKVEVNGQVTAMSFSAEEKAIVNGRAVLMCEDVLTTGGSVERTVKAVEAEGGKVLPFTLVLVNRSGLATVGEKKIIGLIDRAMPMWEPADCPLCKQDSKAIPPKDNWAELNAE
ncbi:MAG: phosphoribosyltransferase family protein [bacterium]